MEVIPAENVVVEDVKEEKPKRFGFIKKHWKKLLAVGGGAVLLTFVSKMLDHLGERASGASDEAPLGSSESSNSDAGGTGSVIDGI